MRGSFFQDLGFSALGHWPSDRRQMPTAKCVESQHKQPNNIENNFRALKCSLAGSDWGFLLAAGRRLRLLYPFFLLFYGYKFSMLALIDNRLIYLGHVWHINPS